MAKAQDKTFDRPGRTVWIYNDSNALLDDLAKRGGWSKVEALDAAIRFTLSAHKAKANIREAYGTARRKRKRKGG